MTLLRVVIDDLDALSTRHIALPYHPLQRHLTLLHAHYLTIFRLLPLLGAARRPFTAAAANTRALSSSSSLSALRSRPAHSKRVFPPKRGPPPKRVLTEARDLDNKQSMTNPAWTVRTLSLRGDDTDLALWVSFDNARFCFGAGEATQRVFVQKRLSMRGIKAMFLPDGATGRGGLPGMIMTAADSGNSELTVVGPPDTHSFLASLRSSVYRDTFAVHASPFPRGSTAPAELLYDTERIAVYGVALRPEEEWVSLEESTMPRPTTLSQADADTYTLAMVQQMFGRAVRSGSKVLPPIFPGQTRVLAPDHRFPLPLPSDADVLTDMVYICRTPEVRGKFDVQKAKALNIPNGPIRKQLTMGETVEFDDPTAPGGKRTVTPEECLAGGGQGAILVVVNCREHNLERLLNSKAFEEYHVKEDGKAELDVHSVVHRVSRSTWMDPRYQAWMAKFGPTTEHLLADGISDHQTVFAGAAWHAFKLSLIDSNMFRLPYYVKNSPPPPELPPNSSVLEADTMLKMHPRKPQETAARHEKDRLFPDTVEGLEKARREIEKQSPEFMAAIQKAQAKIAAIEKERDVSPAPGDDIVVTTLGTGSAIPSKYRNVSSTHLDIPGVGGVLLDCGEGSLGQMRRCFGPEGVKDVLANLRLIFISHMHADHHLGLCAILAERLRLGISSPLYLIAPTPIAVQLEETAWWQHGASREALANIMWLGIHRFKNGMSPTADTADAPQGEADEWGTFLEASMAEDIAAGKRKWPLQNQFGKTDAANAVFRENASRLLTDLGLTNVNAPLVAHRGVAFGLVLEHSSGWKVAYSGDTKPCAQFIEAARGATIVIHEATLEDDKPDVAEAKGHSTFGQAISAGTSMDAKYIILNHFSQRYPKAPNLQLAADGPTVCISFDFMSLRAGDAWKQVHYQEAIDILFREVEAEDPDEGEIEAGVGGEKAKPKTAQKKGGAGDKGSKAERRAGAGVPGLKRESSASSDEHAAKKARPARRGGGPAA